MAGKLVVEEGNLKGLSLSLDQGDAWVIGRDPDESQFIIEDLLVSRKHLLIQRTPEGITLQNISESKPAQVNEETLGNEPRLLQNGDSIKIGGEMIRYYEDASAHIVEEPPAEETEYKDILTRASEAYAPKETSVPLSESPYAPKQEAAPAKHEEEEHPAHPSLFEEEEIRDSGNLAEIDFGVVETGRWLLKVIGGPNNGAEFYMQAGHSYTLGTDPKSCDIVFHDTSVSRQHAKVTVTQEDALLIEDLRSRNGVLINSALIEKGSLSLSTISSPLAQLLL